MKQSLAILFIVATTLSVSSAQPPGEYGEPGGDRRSPNAILAAIDSNGDHEITTDEMKNAFAALKKLDANNNGKLDRDEIHPEMAGRSGRPREGGPDRGGLGDVGHHQGDALRSVAERMRGFDKNKDGQLTQNEIPERMKSVVARHDKNNDEVLDKEELAAMAAQLSSAVPERPGPDGRGGFDGPPNGRRGGPGGPPGAGGGPPSPEQMIQDAFEFDANKDGQLSKSELQKFVESQAHRGGPGGPGGERGRRGGASGREGDDRPSRPARPE